MTMKTTAHSNVPPRVVKPTPRTKLRPRDQITPEYAQQIRQQVLRNALTFLKSR